MDPGVPWELLSQGAEARIYQITFLGRPTIVKERFVKTYRHPALDLKINSSRVQGEARSLQRARAAGLDVPAVYHLDNFRIYMEAVPGKTIKEIIRADPTFTNQVTKDLAGQIAQCLATLHSNDFIHGDLTTSNMMRRDANGKIVIIDFGLSFVSPLQEDKAVDLYVLERAFVSTHPNSEDFFESIMALYFKATKDGKQIKARLNKVRQRGRKRTAFG